MIFDRLAIGTANWGKPYGLSGKQVPREEQKDILDYCQSSGIDTIDTATAYDWDWSRVNSYFNLVIKINENDSIKRIQEIIAQRPYCLMAHSPKVFGQIQDFTRHTPVKRGVSVYESSDFHHYFERAVDVVQIPYSLFDKRAEPFLESKFHIETHVRSVFLQGRILEKVKPHEAIAFCLMNPCVDKVIIGVDSLQQLKDNLRYFHRLNEMEIKDEQIIDPRKW